MVVDYMVFRDNNRNELNSNNNMSRYHAQTKFLKIRPNSRRHILNIGRKLFPDQ